MSFLTLPARVRATGGMRGAINPYYAVGGEPAWAPPPELFAIVWTGLYTCMTIVSLRAWNKLTSAGRGWMLLNFVCNWAWMPVFLGVSPTAALALMVPLLVSAAFVQNDLWAVDRTAAGLWAPYVGWLGVALILNLQVVGGWVKPATSAPAHADPRAWLRFWS